MNIERNGHLHRSTSNKENEYPEKGISKKDKITRVTGEGERKLRRSLENLGDQIKESGLSGKLRRSKTFPTGKKTKIESSQEIESLSLKKKTKVHKKSMLTQKMASEIFGSDNERTYDAKDRNAILKMFGTEKCDITISESEEPLKATLVGPKSGVKRGEQSEFSSIDEDKWSGKVYVYCSGSFGCYEKYALDILPALVLTSEGKKDKVLLFDYRGFGENKYLTEDGAAPTAEQVKEDALAVAQYLINERGIDPKNIIMYGYSLGGAPAAYVAAELGTQLELDRVFTKSGDVAKDALPHGIKQVGKIITNKKFSLDTLAYLKDFQGDKVTVILGAEETGKNNKYLKQFTKVLIGLNAQGKDTHLTVIENLPHISDGSGIKELSDELKAFKYDTL
jgi:hypothetical protein